MLAPPRVSDVMNETVETVSPGTAALVAARRLHEKGAGSIVVLDDGTIVGILTESDLVAVVAEERDGEAVVIADAIPGAA